jgi:hypothetical protein
MWIQKRETYVGETIRLDCGTKTTYRRFCGPCALRYFASITTKEAA